MCSSDLAVAMVFGFISNANAAKTLKCQTVLNTKADEVKMLKDFEGRNESHRATIASLM